MASLRLIFLVMLASIGISDTTIGADANDKLDTLLSYMVHMREEMKLLSQKVDGVEEEVKKADRDVFTVTRLLGPWSFIGNGVQPTMDEQVSANKSTFLQCFGFCSWQFRDQHGSSGVVYKESDGWCGCNRDGRGFQAQEGYVLYQKLY